MTREASVDAVWRFATGFYALPGVAQSCIDLQDGAGIDVCVMLALLHRGAVRRLPLDEATARGADRHVMMWREEIVLPLRRARRAAGRFRAADPSVEVLYSALKAQELGGERIEMEMVAAWLRNVTPGGADMRSDQIVGTVVAALAQGPVDVSLHPRIATLDSALKIYLAGAGARDDD